MNANNSSAFIRGLSVLFLKTLLGLDGSAYNGDRPLPSSSIECRRDDEKTLAADERE